MEKELVPVIFPIDSYTSPRARMNALGRFVIVYVGSFGGWYPTEEILDFYGCVKKEYPTAFALILTKQTEIAKGLRDRGFAEEDMLVQTVSPADVFYWVQGADIAISFIKPCYSKQASSPTKVAEYLACGIPVISNRGIGDLDQLLTEHKVGVLLDDFSQESYTKAVRNILSLMSDYIHDSVDTGSATEVYTAD